MGVVTNYGEGVGGGGGGWGGYKTGGGGGGANVVLPLRNGGQKMF